MDEDSFDFENKDDLILYIPCENREAYEAHPLWSKAANIKCFDHTVTVFSADETRGTVSGGGEFEYEAEVTITATAEYGYHFAKWNDGDTSNPRTFVLTRDTVFTAQFEKNTYTVSAAAEHGWVFGTGSAQYLDTITLNVTTTDYGYHFTQWSDSVTANPRTFIITQDTSFTAEFGKNI